jgi:DNA-binding XRE family transcriptional regulator
MRFVWVRHQSPPKSKTNSKRLRVIKSAAGASGRLLRCLELDGVRGGRPSETWRSRASVAYWRGIRGWTQVQLAKESKVRRNVIADVERQARNVSLSVIERLARALGVALSQLLGMP